MSIQIKRAYDEAEESDGRRVLVDRIWPRGVSKDKARLDDWIKAVSPSAELRQWFGHDPARWDEFKRRYGEELDASEDAREALDDLRQRASEATVTLVFAARDSEHNNAVFLKERIEGG